MYSKGYSEEIIENIRMNSDIVEIISEQVKLDKRGKNYVGLCPFHRENTPSFTVDESKQLYYCFGCSQGGNVFTFIMNYENIDFVEAVKYLADKAGILLPESEDKDQKELSELRAEIQNINTEVARYYNRCLFSEGGKKALRYLFDRRLETKIIRKFGLGYAPSNSGLLRYLNDKGFTEKAIRESGLFNISKEGKLYERFRNRIMFPIFDVVGHVVAFSGRVFETLTPSDRPPPKYINSPDTLLYNKGRHLYGLNFAKTSGSKELILVEGNVDVISLNQSGITNVVACLGTAFTDMQCKLIKKYSPEGVILIYDSDSAGQKATSRAIELLTPMSCNVKVAQLAGKAKDPDEYIQKYGKDEFNERIRKALSPIDYKLSLVELKEDDDDSKLKYFEEAIGELLKIRNSIEREIYINKLSKEHNISVEAIKSEVIRRSKSKATIDNQNEFKERSSYLPSKNGKYKYNSTFHDELYILAVISEDNNVYRKLKKEISIDLFKDEKLKEIAKRVIDKLERDNEITSAEFLNYIEDKEISNNVSRILNTEIHCENCEKAAIEKIEILKKKDIISRQDDILARLKEKGISDEEKFKLTKELNEIIRSLKK